MNPTRQSLKVPPALLAAHSLTKTSTTAVQTFMSPLRGPARLSGSKRSLAVIALVPGFSTVLYLIADLDRPGYGMLHVSQQALVDVRRSMK